MNVFLLFLLRRLLNDKVISKKPNSYFMIEAWHIKPMCVCPVYDISLKRHSDIILFLLLKREFAIHFHKIGHRKCRICRKRPRERSFLSSFSSNKMHFQLRGELNDTNPPPGYTDRLKQHPDRLYNQVLPRLEI